MTQRQEKIDIAFNFLLGLSRKEKRDTHLYKTAFEKLYGIMGSEIKNEPTELTLEEKKEIFGVKKLWI